MPNIGSIDDLKRELLSFRLRERTKTETEVKQTTIRRGGDLPDYVMTRKDGVMMIDEEATERIRKLRPTRLRVRTKSVRERKEVVVGTNADVLEFLLTELFVRFGQEPEAIASWREICERARDDNVRDAIKGRIHDICGEYDVVPLAVKGFKNIPESKYLKTAAAEAAFLKMMFLFDKPLFMLLATTRAFVTMQDDMEDVLLELWNAPRMPSVMKPFICLLLSRSDGRKAEQELIRLACADDSGAVFAWEALARRRAEVAAKTVAQALKSRNDAVRLGAIRYIGSMKREDLLPDILQLGADSRISEIELFSVWLALESICGKGQVPFDPRLWKKIGQIDAGKVEEDSFADDAEDEQYNKLRSYYDIDLTSRRIVFVCDRSLSMTVVGRWQQLIQNLLTTAQELSSDYRFTAVFYADDTEVFSRLLIPANASTMKRFDRFMQKQAPKGEYTYTSMGLEIGLKVPRVNTLYLMSDGLPFGECPTQTFTKWHESDPRGQIVLHTISVEAEHPYQDDLLFLLAQLGWGDFVASEESKLQYFISADRQTIKIKDDRKKSAGK